MRFTFSKPLFTAALATCLATVGATHLFADEVLRRVQQELRDQGFYYGSIDGSPGDETTQAIRRYQIRNGLTVSGQLDDQTHKAIDRTEAAVAKGSSGSRSSTRPHIASSASSNDDQQYAQATPPPLVREAPAPPPAVRSVPHPEPETDSGDENDSSTGNAPTRPDLRVPPGGGQAPAGALPPGAVLPSPGLSAMFQRTPFEFAPPPVQTDVLRRAQAALLRDGFYDGDADGVPGPRTAEALSNLQEVSHIRASGRLDVQTLAILHLLPRTQPGFRPYAYGPGPGPIYQGRIVQP